MSRAIVAALSIVAFAFSPLTQGADDAKAGTAVPAATPAPASAGAIETGLGAVYSDRLHGRRTASGERYDRARLTAAHKTLPFGTKVKVTNTKNQKSVVVRINDRGPTQAGRILDLSPTAAKALGIGAKGMGEVTAEVVGEASKRGDR